MTNNSKCDNIRIDTLTKAQLNFLEFCKEFGWGKVEVTIRDGEPVGSKELEKTHRHDI